MGDGVENITKQPEERQQVSPQALNQNGMKCLITWTDGIQDELWDWSPAARVQDVFAKLHTSGKIGKDCFLVSDLPQYFDADDGEDSSDQDDSGQESFSDLLSRLKSFAVDSPEKALCEIIVLSRADKKMLAHEVVRQRKEAKSLKDELIPDMFRAIISYMESAPRQKVYVFAREI